MKPIKCKGVSYVHSLLGLGIHGDEEGRLALIPRESEKYKELHANTAIKKKKAFNKFKV